MVDNNFQPITGQSVRYARKIVESDGETVRLGQIGTVIEVRENTPADDVFGPVTVVVHMDGEPAPGELRHEAVFRPEELEPVRTDDSVPTTDEEVVEYLTGTVPDDEPVGALAGEPHALPDGAAAERRVIHPDYDNVSGVAVRQAATGVPGVLDAIVDAAALPPAAVAAALRAVADVLDGAK
jgi:hypothetical protein